MSKQQTREALYTIAVRGANLKGDNLSADTINNLSADTINNLSAYTINNLSADTIKNLSAYTIKNLSPDALAEREKLWAKVPLVDKPYTQLLADIKNKTRCYKQSDWGNIREYDVTKNVCETAMCIAGHLTHMGGAMAYALLQELDYTYAKVGGLIHAKTHPNMPCMDFYITDNSVGMAYIETMAEYEANQPARS